MLCTMFNHRDSVIAHTPQSVVHTVLVKFGDLSIIKVLVVRLDLFIRNSLKLNSEDKTQPS